MLRVAAPDGIVDQGEEVPMLIPSYENPVKFVHFIPRFSKVPTNNQMLFCRFRAARVPAAVSQHDWISFSEADGIRSSLQASIGHIGVFEDHTKSRNHNGLPLFHTAVSVCVSLPLISCNSSVCLADQIRSVPFIVPDPCPEVKGFYETVI